MALTASALVLWTAVEPRSCRLVLVDFLVRMWRLNACERLTLPLPRTRKRFFAPLLVFIFGMTTFLFAAHGGALGWRGLLARRQTGFGLVRVMLGYDDFFGGQQHHHLPTFKPWKLFDDAVRLKVAANALEQTDTELLMRHFPATVTQRYLRLVAFAEEPDQVSQLDLVVAIVGTRPEFDFLDLYLLELELGFVRALGLPVLELAEIHDPAYRGLGQ